MKVWEPIKILCRQDPEIEVLALLAGFPPERGVIFAVERVYETHTTRKKGVVLTTRAVFETKGHSSECEEGKHLSR